MKRQRYDDSWPAVTTDDIRDILAFVLFVGIFLAWTAVQ